MGAISESRLDEMLGFWRREYGPGGTPCVGKNILQVLIDHKGEPPRGGGAWTTPTSRTVGDEVEDAVMRMQNTKADGPSNHFFRSAMVLRVEHLTPGHWPESERLSKLRRIGLSMSRDTYYRSIKFARAYLAEALATRIAA